MYAYKTYILFKEVFMIKASEKKRQAVMDKIASLRPVIRGSIVILKRPCIRQGCQKCKQGLFHPATYLSVTKNRKTHISYLPKYAIRDVEKAKLNYKKAKELLDVLCEVDLNILLEQLRHAQKDN